MKRNGESSLATRWRLRCGAGLMKNMRQQSVQADEVPSDYRLNNKFQNLYAHTFARNCPDGLRSKSANSSKRKNSGNRGSHFRGLSFKQCFVSSDVSKLPS